jgi:hypothetical protein
MDIRCWQICTEKFQKGYQDYNFTVLDVLPYVDSPSSKGCVAFIHHSLREDILLHQDDSRDQNYNNTIRNTKTLPYNNRYFDKIALEISIDKKGVSLNAR